MTDGAGRTVALVGATGDLGGRMLAALARRRVAVRVLIRAGTPPVDRDVLRARGATPLPVDFDDVAALARALSGTECVISVLNGLAPTLLDLQGRVLDAAVVAGVPRFIPSDFSLDFTRTRPGDNRNMDLRRTFMTRVDAAPIQTTSILNGAFADLLTGEAPIVLRKIRRILYWGDADQVFDFTSKDDVADYTADAALDRAAPRFLRIAGDEVSPRGLAALMTRLDHREWKPLRAGGIGRLSALIGTVRALSPRSDAPFPAWQGMQYLRDMSSGRGKLSPLDNDRYGKTDWTRADAVLAAIV
ncbi:NmrA family NAD(P)-binding protein [Methylobacterium sp. J-090]|uniref:NmrA family NAD(P)-binding protein n=1 Tax=Methylobacterium sp. J-090 TaxID=2836666 RepID=UPI001FBBA376|nr:NmrA family NAD(P)-binding protein [Methylobacterium sp. J-090]MCJ2082450.1 NmrA family NAD(P)-binding protein [Methylobacterium sp. J-090]